MTQETGKIRGDAWSAVRETAAAHREAAEPSILFVSALPADSLDMAGGVVAGMASENVVVTPLSAPAASPSPASPLYERVASSARRSIELVETLARQIRRHDVVYIVAGPIDTYARVVGPAIVAARFFGRPVVLHVVSAEVEQFLGGRGAVVRRVLKLADRVVVGSRYLQRAFDRAGIAASLLASPVEIGAVAQRTIRQVQPKVLVDSPLEPDHNVACAVKAFRLVKQKYPRAELVITGRGSTRGRLEDLIEALRVYGVSFVDDAPSETAGSCDVYLNSSSIDECPPGLVRAMAGGLPVVTTDADGLLHMVRDRVTALVAAVNDHGGLADRIIELVENPELAGKLSERGAEEARKYAWTRVRQDWVNLFRGLAKR